MAAGLRALIMFAFVAVAALCAFRVDAQSEAGQTSPSGNTDPPASAPQDSAPSKYADLVARSAALSEDQKKQALDLFTSGFELWKTGDCVAAGLAFKQGLDIDPANGPANFYYGDCLLRSGDKKNAADYLSRATELAAGKPEDFKARADLQKIAAPEISSPQTQELQSSLAGDFASSPFDGVWKITATAWGMSVDMLWKFSVSGKELHVVGGGLQGAFGTQTFTMGNIDGDKIKLIWSGGASSTWEGTLVSPTKIQGHFSQFLVSGSWVAERQ